MRTLPQLLLCGLLLLLPVAGLAGQQEAEALYRQAKAEADPERQASLLKASIEELETFEARYALGEVLIGLARHEPAREQLKRALEIAASDKARARATYLVASAFLEEGREADAVPLLRRALGLHPYPVIAERLKGIEVAQLGQPLTAGEITRALTSSATRAFGVKPTVSLRIGFELDSAALSPQGGRQARELGQALAKMKGRSFEIVGHTDRQGEAGYNDKLSLRRAETIKSLLIADFAIPVQTLTVLGKGERELLYPGDSEQDHALNRRVEIAVH